MAGTGCPYYVSYVSSPFSLKKWFFSLVIRHEEYVTFSTLNTHFYNMKHCLKYVQKKFCHMDEDFQKLTAKTMEVNWVEKKCPSYFKIKGTSVYLLPQYKPWWGLWQSGLVVSLAGCGAALHPANCHPQDLGICGRSPGNTLSFISLENRSSVIQKQCFECKTNIIHAACAAAHTYIQHVLWYHSKGTQASVH